MRRAALHSLSATLLALLVSLASGASAEEKQPFELMELPSSGRTVAVEIADLDGDGRGDLLEVAFVGLPPGEQRRLRVRFQNSLGELPTAPDLDLPLPEASAAYDLARLDGGPGSELLLLGPRGVTLLSFEGGALQRREARVPEGPTLGTRSDERGLDRLPLTTRALDREALLVVPCFDRVFLLTPAGELRARLAVGGRSNYFIQPLGTMVAESDIQLFYDAPRVRFGDVDGDGRTDVVAASRHEIRVFLRRPDGSFPSQADRRHWLERVSPDDHVRGSGAVRPLVQDLDADGRADLVIAQIAGGILDATTTTSVHLNRNGQWDLATPDAVLASEQSVSGVQLLDLDADGRLEILRSRIPVNVLELIELLLTRAVDTHLQAWGFDPQGAFDPEPRFERKLGVPLSFETGRARGFIPTFDFDLNADGFPDLLTSGDGSRLEIFLGGRESRYRDRSARQHLDTEGRVRGGQLDGDGLTDLVLYNPRRPDAPIRLARNRGLLPGTRPSLGSRSGD